MSSAPAATLPSVAVCIPTYNQADYLAGAVESALAQTYAGPIEIWVSDDASTDGTAAVLERLEQRHETLNVLRQPQNVGLAANVSSLLRAPKTDFIIRLDSDDELTPTFAEEVLGPMAAEPSAGYGHTAITEIDASGARVKGRELRRSSGFQPAEEALRASLVGYRTVANVLAFRRGALEELSFYDGRPESGEDYDLSVRMADAGYGNVYVDRPLARYRVWEDSSGTRSRRKQAQLDGYLQIFEEAIGPAWERRGWSMAPVRRRRRSLAAHNCAHCFEPQYSPEERRRLVETLKAIGDGPSLRARLLLCRLGCGPAIESAARFRGRQKDRAKALLKPTLARLRGALDR